MNRYKSMGLKGLLLILVLTVVLLAGCSGQTTITELPPEDNYTFDNSDVSKAQPDAGIVIDGVLDEAVYQENNWLYLHNEDGGNKVNIAMTSHYGEKGMYFVFDVTESVPIYVNPDRASYMNSCIELYLAPSYVSSVQANSILEIDLLPTGDMQFKKSNGAYGYTNVITTHEKMAVMGATTKGGPVNTEDCYGYNMELFIPWDYLQWLGFDVDSMRNGFVYVDPAHITSNNITGTNPDLDRYWYFYAQQNGAGFGDVAQYFRFNGEGVLGTIPVELQQGEHYTISGFPYVLPGMTTVATITPEEGYALTSVLVNGQEQIRNVHYNQDGSVTLTVRSTADGVKISAKAEAVTAEGSHTLSGKVVLNNINKDSLQGLMLTYVGPKGERPLTVDANGNFELKDMAQGYYTLKAEKKGYQSVNRGIYLNRDLDIDLVLEYDYFQVTKGTCWVLEEQNNGILYKQGGAGEVLSNASYHNFTLRTTIKYDPELAKQGDNDLFKQQRTGVKVRFSNEKTWHIDLLKEGDQYILQYAQHSGNNSVTKWNTIHKLNAEQSKRYTGEKGIELKIMRQGNYAAIWLDNALIKIEILDKQYDACSAQLGFESWVSNRDLMEIPFSIANHSTVDVKNSPFHIHAKSWNISGQYSGTVIRYGEKGGAWLDGQINCNDITTVAKDMSPDTKDFSMAYIFKFSNGEQFRVRLNHTDNDGAFRIQSMAGSTVAPAWKNAYTLTEEEAALALGDGISYRVQILGTTAYVYLEGKEVCTFDLSTVVATGKPSGIENATAKVSFALDGNLNGTTVLPFKMADTSKSVTVTVAETANGSIVADKAGYKLGETVTLTLKPEDGYYCAELQVNGEKAKVNWDGTCSFVATEHIYQVTARFVTGKFAENKDSAWNLTLQNQDVLKLNHHTSGNSGWLSAIVDANDIATFVRDTAPAARDFSMIYEFSFSNGEKLVLRLNHTDGDGKYRVQVMSGSTVSAEWKNHYTLTDAEAAKIAQEGINFRVMTKSGYALVYMDGVQVATLDLTKVVATGNPSNIADTGVRIRIRMDGNLGQELEIPFTLVDAATQVTVTFPELINGTVTGNQNTYQLGDTVTLTVNPNAGYAQKLYINGEPLLLDWRSNTYSFVATENTYEITGSFEPGLNLVASDAGRWDTSNQAHGILNPYYPTNDDSWWMDIKGEYESITVRAKNYLPVADSMDGVNGSVGFGVVLRVHMDNGKNYAFRIYNDKGTYAHQWFGGSGSATGWGGWKNIHAAYAEALGGDGVDYKLERTAGNQLTLYIDGVKMETYTMAGVTAANKVVSMGVQHNGNKGVKVQLPVKMGVFTDASSVQLNISAMTNGTVTPEKSKYQIGDMVTLAVTPSQGYAQKLYINGEPLLLDYATGKYSFVATEEAYDITGSFVAAGKWFWTADWNLINQAHGVAYTPAHPESPNRSGDLVPEHSKTDYLRVLVKDPSHGDQKEYAVVLKAHFAGGKKAEVRLIDRDDNGKYCLQAMGDSFSSWDTLYWLTAEENAAVKDGEGVWYAMSREGATLNLLINGKVVKQINLAAKGVTAETVLEQLKLQTYNFGYAVEIPYALEEMADAGNVTLHIAEMSDGKVVADKQSYQIGDTVNLTVTPDTGYAQKLYINGEPLLLDWKTNTYSFVATEETYQITGSFEPSLQLIPSDAARWDGANQAHGVLKAYYPNNNDAWFMDIGGDHKVISFKARNLWPVEESYEGIANGGGFRIVLRATMDNGKNYAFSIWINTDKQYAYNHFGGGNSATGWSGAWCLPAEKNAEAVAALNGEGADFKLERIDGNHFQISLNGTVLETYTIAGVTEANKVVSMGFQHYGNRGEYIDFPFTVGDPASEDASGVAITIPALENGAVVADKAGYALGDTVTLTVAPDAGYAQKLYINGEPLLLDYATGKYSFVATEEAYEIAGSFEPAIKWFWTADWKLNNQGHGIAHAPAHSGTEIRTGELVPEKEIYNHVKALVKDPSHGDQKEYAVVLKMAFANGKTAAVRLIDRDDNGKYCLQAMGDSFSSWDTFYWLTAEENAAVKDGDGVWYGMTRKGTTLTLTINGNVVKQIDLSAKGVTAETKLDQVKLQAYNHGYAVDIPFVFEKVQ